MKARVLPPEEWSKLERTGVKVVTGLHPKDQHVVVVEDAEGKVIACMTVLRATHLEGAWIDPEHRNAGVTRRLMGLSWAIAGALGTEWMFAGAADERMRDILGRLGGVKVPGLDTYMLGLGGKECRPS